MADKKKGFDLNSLLNAKSKGAAVQAAGPAKEEENTFSVVMLDVEDLMPGRDNFYSTENIDELAAAIELSGCIEQNLVVKPQVHGKYEVIAGHRRRLAALKLAADGREEYRKVPCLIRKESDEIRDRLSMIFTNATARQLTDWEKVRQAEQLKEVLTQYKKALQEENKDKPKEERQRTGRIREIVAQMLHTSTTQVGRMEAISSHLSQDFKEELEKGNINISTAHELSRLDEEGQKKAYEQYEEKGGLHIKDVKREEKEEITDEQAEKAQDAIKDAIRGEVNRAVFKVKDNVAAVERVLRKHFSRSFQGKKSDGGKYIYRFQPDGLTIIDTTEWGNFLISYSDLAEIIVFMIGDNQLFYDGTTKEVQEEETGEETTGETAGAVKETQAAVRELCEKENIQLPGQMDMSGYPEYVPEPQEKGLDFTKWIQKKYGMAQYTLIGKEVRAVIASELEANKGNLPCPAEWENRLTDALSAWVMRRTKEYQRYLQGQAGVNHVENIF